MKIAQILIVLLFAGSAFASDLNKYDVMIADCLDYGHIRAEIEKVYCEAAAKAEVLNDVRKSTAKSYEYLKCVDSAKSEAACLRSASKM